MSTFRSLAALVLCATPALSQGFAPDGWSARTVLRTPDGWYAVPVHATLMPNGLVACIGYARDTEDPALATASRRSAFVFAPIPAGDPVPPELTVFELPEPIDAPDIIVPPALLVSDDLFCTGNALTATGELFTAGGTRTLIDFTNGNSITVGLSYATRFDGSSWWREPADMVVAGPAGSPARWYPAVTRLPDQRMLVTSGYDVVFPIPSPNLSAEAWDPDDGCWDVVSPLGEPPSVIFNRDYTHPVVLPQPVGGFDLVMLGEAGLPAFLSLNGPVRWNVSLQSRPGTLPGETPNYGASTAPLPIRVHDGEWGYANGSVLVAGGDHMTSHQHSVDVYDPVADAWLPRVDMGVLRHHPSTVVLPDGRVVVVAGHDFQADPNLQRASYIDPAAEMEHRLGSASMGEVRGYHTVALLMPDGSVLVAGGRDLDTNTSGEKSDMRTLWPSYVLGPRPEITQAPATIHLGQAFQVATRGGPAAEVVLIALGSMTHSFDFSQRYVQLQLANRAPIGPGASPAGAGADSTVFALAPPSAAVAPPGPYMLFALNAKRIPSEARIVQLLN